jgi:hypothetical protein
MADDIVIGAKQLPNPKGVKPQSDEELPTRSRNMDTSNATGSMMTDMRNPAKADVEIEKHHHDHPLMEHFSRSPTARTHFGAGIKISEN